MADRLWRDDGTTAALLDALPHQAAVLDPRGVPVFVNRLEREYLGMADDGDVGLAPQEYLHPDDVALFVETISALLHDGRRAQTVELRIRRHDGEHRWHLCTAAPMAGPDGAAPAWLVTFVDIDDLTRTQQRLTEAERQASETTALLTGLLAGAPVGFAYLDHDLRFVHVNARLAEINGLPIEQHLGRRVGEVLPQLWDEIEPMYRRALAGESVTQEEVAALQDSGDQRHLLVTYFPVRPNPQQVGGVGLVLRDVTVERLLAAGLNRAQRLQAIGQLAGGVAHDFNNVLATVTLSAELLRAEVTDPRQHVGLDRILAAARSATDLTRKLLLFARRQPTNPISVDVGATVHRVLDLLAGTIGSTITLDVDVDGAPPVLIDPTHVEQVVLNLVINARDAMPAGGTLSVSAARVPVESPSDGAGSVALVVSDTGTGMTAEVRDRALEPFFTTKDAGVGTGLGLSTVDGIVNGAGGRVTISSEPGAGTTVRVELPASGTGIVAAVQVGGVVRRGHGERVLVVEDQDDLRSVIATILRTAGYAVQTAQDGDDAVRVLGEGAVVDVVVTDVVMPGLTGPEVAAAAASSRPGTPVVMMSGYVGGVLAAHGVPADAMVLGKPFTGDELLAAVSEALGGVAARNG